MSFAPRVASPAGLTLAMTLALSSHGGPRVQHVEPLHRVADLSLADAIAPNHQAGRSIVRSAPVESDAQVAVIALDPTAYEALRPQTRITVQLPLAASATLTLALDRFDVLTPDAVIVVTVDDGQKSLPRPDVQLWHGTVQGDPDSRVFLGLTPTSAQGYVVSGNKTYSISTVPQRDPGPLAGRTVVTEAGALREAARFAPIALPAPQSCGGAILPPGVTPPPLNTGALPAHSGPHIGLRDSDCRVIKVAVDADNEFFFNLFGGVTEDATAYITLLMGAVSSVYQNEVHTQIQVPYMHLWGDPDPYSATSTQTELPEFRVYWIANRPAVPHDLAHLFSARNLGGGIAYLSVLCNAQYGFAVSSHLSGYFPYPIEDNNGLNWDLNVVAHEIGHNFSTGHTHDPSSYNPPIDGCGNAYLSPPLPQDCTVAQQHNGTIMSYCHICPGGEANLKITFGPRPIQVIESFLALQAQSCGTTLIPFSIQNVDQSEYTGCPGGPITFTVYATGPNLVYTWYHNGVLIPDASAASLTIDSLTPADVGFYTPVVSNQCGTVEAQSGYIDICYADFNCSGDITPQDLFSFLPAWFSNSPAADVNGSGSVTIQDLFDWLALWFQGYC